MEARRAAVSAVVRRGASRGTSHGMGRAGSSIHRCTGKGVRPLAVAASVAGGPRAMVLRLESAVAVEPDVRLSSLEDRSQPVVAILVPAGNGGVGGGSNSAGAEEPRTAGRFIDFRR